MKYYSEDHIWVEIRGEEATVGISQYAVDELGEIEYIELPVEDEDVIVGEDIGLLESAANSQSIYAPISGTIIAVNEELADAPEMLNSDPYGAWIIKVEGVSAQEELLDAAAYEAFCAEEA